MTKLSKSWATEPSPLEAVEGFISTQEWPYIWIDQDELAFEIPGKWGLYKMFFVWKEEIQVVHMSCVLGLKFTPEQKKSLYELINIINQRLWIGHFELCSNEKSPVFHHSHLISRASEMGLDKVQVFINLAHAEAEQYYPAFKLVLENGMSAKQAVEAAILDVEGEA